MTAPTVFTATLSGSIAKLIWSAAVACQIRVNSPTGTLFASGGIEGTATTGAWASVGMQFFLLDATGKVLSALTLTANPPPPKTGNVKDWGAVGDGKTDDTAAINNCFAACSERYIPQGKYLLSNTLAVTNPGIIRGDGKGVSVLQLASSSSVVNAIIVSTPHVRFKDFTVDGNIANAGASWGIAAWQPTTQYWANPGPTGGYGGGPDCVYHGNIVWQCEVNHVSGTEFGMAQWKIIQALTQHQLAAMQWATLFAVNCPGDVGWSNVEMLGSQFGVFLYSGKGYSLDRCYAHDFGVQYTGNNSTMDAVHSMPGTDLLRVTDCAFENIYVPTLGPGATSAIFSSADRTIVRGNTAKNCLNRGGRIVNRIGRGRDEAKSRPDG